MSQLTAFLPQDRLHALARGENLPDRSNGAALFADVSGFTPLTRTFSEALGSKRGAEALLSVLNPLFEALIEPVHRYGGSVIGFAGDAITCWFEEKDEGTQDLSLISSLHAEQTLHHSSLRAVAAALAMQVAMKSFATVHTPIGRTVTLSINAAIAAGPARRFVVGDPTIQRIDTLAGATLLRMAEAEKHAERGEVVVSREVAENLGEVLITSAWRGKKRFAVVDGLKVAVQAAPWPPLPDNVLGEAEVRQWMLPDIYEQLHSNASSLGDLRPVMPLMVQFGGIDFDADDEAGVKLDAFVCWAQRIIHRHGGVLLQLTIGDKGAFLYAPFGAPLAHENDPERAMKAALALRDASANLAAYITPLRIGLTRGEVWTGSCGGHGRSTYGVMGSEVNLAARLMSKAESGQILVSGRMSEFPGFRFEYVGDLVFKGFDKPLPTYSLLGEQMAGERVFQTAMVGREAELARLGEWAQPIFENRFAGLAWIYGEAGMGKSRLLYELGRQLSATRQPPAPGVLWLMGQCDQILRQSLNPFKYLLHRYFNQAAGRSAAENRARFDEILDSLIRRQAAVPASAGSKIGKELERVRSFLGALVDLRWDGSLYEQLEPKLRFENTLYAVKTLIQAESLFQPVVVVIEDAHWLDADSRGLLKVLTRYTADYPFGVVLASRYQDDGRPLDVGLEPEVSQTTIDLNQLSASGIAALAAQVLEEHSSSEVLNPQKAVSPEVAALLAEKTNGNPFFIEQLLLDLHERGAVAVVGGQWAIVGRMAEVPTNLNAVLVARLDRLAAEVKAVVQTAAVLGREFEVQVLSNMLRGDSQLPVKVQQAEAETVWMALSEIRYLFKHALLRDAAYDMQLRARLRDLHALALESFETLYAADLAPHYAALAYHAEGSENQDKQREYYRLAGDAARMAYQNVTALDYYARLLPLLTTPGEQIDLQLNWGGVLELLGQWEQAENHYQAALALAQSSPQSGEQEVLQARCLFVMGRSRRWRGDFSMALERLQQAQAASARQGNRGEQCRMLIELGSILGSKGDYAAAHQHLDESLVLARELNDNPLTANALNSLGILILQQADYPTARALFEESLVLGRKMGAKRHVALTLGNLGIITFQQGDYAAARLMLEDALVLQREIGDIMNVAVSLGNIGVATYHLGDYAAARALYEECLNLGQALGFKQIISLSYFNLGFVAVEQKDYLAARNFHTKSLAQAQQVNDKKLIAYALAGLASVAVQSGGKVEEIAGAATQRSARLAAAVESLLTSIKGAMEPFVRKQYERTVAAARAALGEDEFSEAWAEGEKMPLEEVIGYALEEKL